MKIKLCLDLSLTGVMAEDIKDVYVLGHSLGQADYEYFRFLKSATSLKSEYEKEAKINLEKYNPDVQLTNLCTAFSCGLIMKIQILYI